MMRPGPPRPGVPGLWFRVRIWEMGDESGRQVTREKSEGRNPGSAYSGVAATRLYAVLIRGSDFLCVLSLLAAMNFFACFAFFAVSRIRFYLCALCALCG